MTQQGLNNNNLHDIVYMAYSRARLRSKRHVQRDNLINEVSLQVTLTRDEVAAYITHNHMVELSIMFAIWKGRPPTV